MDLDSSNTKKENKLFDKNSILLSIDKRFFDSIDKLEWFKEIVEVVLKKITIYEAIILTPITSKKFIKKHNILRKEFGKSINEKDFDLEVEKTIDKVFNKYLNKNKEEKRVVILNSLNNWQMIYIDGKLFDEGHQLGEGDNFTYLLELSEKENFSFNDVISHYLKDDDEKLLEKYGDAPINLGEFKYNYLFKEPIQY